MIGRLMAPGGKKGKKRGRGNLSEGEEDLFCMLGTKKSS